MNAPRFILADQALTSTVGHFYEYDVSLLEHVPDGMEALVLANVELEPSLHSFARPFFHCDFWRVTGTDAPERGAGEVSVGVSGHGLHENDCTLYAAFLEDLRVLFETHKPGPQDVLFIPNINPSNLAALADFLGGLPKGACPKLKLLIRRNVYIGRPNAEQFLKPAYELAVFRHVFNQLKGFPHTKCLQFYTDTKRLKTEYETISSYPFTVLPIPFPHKGIQVKPQPDRPLKIVSLGNARVEKGFHYFPQIIREMQSAIHSGACEFILQSFPNPEPEVLKAREELRGIPGVTLLDDPLTDEAYYQLLNDADILLLLYDPVMYYSRSSCVFIESYVSATPFLTLSGTWMAETMTPGTGMAAKTPDQCGEALRELITRYPEFLEKMQQARGDWCRFHHPSVLMDLLMKE